MTTTTTNPSSVSDLIGHDWHVLRGTKYAGVFTVSEATPVEDDWILVRGGGAMWHVRLVDCFPTEADARAEGSARRKPRQSRQSRQLYGDYAQLAAFNGIRTDGTGRRAR